MEKNKVLASIITIGDELLIGQTIDTNSAWISQQLNKLGIWVKRRVAVGDVYDDIWNALTEESRHASIILITGGLGPTADDITKPLLCSYFGGQMIVDEEALNNVKTIFQKYLNRPLLPSNLKQAEVPDVCTVLHNQRGTAPGMWFEKAGIIYVSMPGVPFEMKYMMEHQVLPRLSQSFTLPVIAHRTLLTAGIGESFLAERIKDFESALPPHIKLAYLPNYGLVRLRLTATGTNQTLLHKEIDHWFATLKNEVHDVMVIDEDKTLEEAVGMLLHKKQQTVSTAESCTGGYIAHLLTSVAGSSAYYKGSVVSYDNEVKENVLQVPADILQSQGAVSESTVIQMAQSARKLLKTDYALSVSGIMGPGGGTADKPVGTVWMAVASDNGVRTQKYHARFDRERNITITAIQALNLLRTAIIATE